MYIISDMVYDPVYQHMDKELKCKGKRFHTKYIPKKKKRLDCGFKY